MSGACVRWALQRLQRRPRHDAVNIRPGGGGLLRPAVLFFFFY